HARRQTDRGAHRRHGRRGAPRRRHRDLPHDARVRHAARPLLHDGRVLRLPRDDRRRRQSPGVPRARDGRHGNRDAAWQARARAMSTVTLRDRYDVVVVGAGPAGLAAASICARSGFATALFDEQATVGGQIYRAITETRLRDRAVLGEDYWAGEKLAHEFLASGAQYVPRSTVWSLTPECEVGVSVSGGSRLLQATHVILATGALERPFPIPGWTLPGVMTAGAAQAMLKSSNAVPDDRTVIAGTGPLLFLLASQLLKAGARIDAVLDTTPRENRSRALPHFLSFLLSPYFVKGVTL